MVVFNLSRLAHGILNISPLPLLRPVPSAHSLFTIRPSYPPFSAIRTALPSSHLSPNLIPLSLPLFLSLPYSLLLLLFLSVGPSALPSLFACCLPCTLPPSLPPCSLLRYFPLSLSPSPPP